MINNLSQLKKAFNNKIKFEVVEHCRPECIGQIRQVNVTQSNGFYSIIPSEPNSKATQANGGKGSWLEYGKASFWRFKDGLCSVFINDNHKPENLILSFRIIE